MNIGVFDSGRGGEIMASELKTLLPQYEYVVVNDRANVPYGSRTDAEIIQLATAAIAPLIEASCDIIVIACNTATMAAITSLRAAFPSVQFVGVEPMIKPAAATSATRHITVLATPLTLASERYRFLKSQFADGLAVDEPDTTGWAAAIEHGNSDSIDFAGVLQSIESGSDTVILACTHYHALRHPLHSLLPGVTLLEPTEAVARQIIKLMETRPQTE